MAYRALAHHFEHFLQVYQERFEPAFGYLRSAVKKAVYRYLDCGILESPTRVHESIYGGIPRGAPEVEARIRDFMIGFLDASQGVPARQG